VTRDEAAILCEKQINPSAQRLAIARYVLHSDEHPSADEVWNRVRQSCPSLSRATVYNTLNLFVEKGLLRQLVLTEGRVIFDPRIAPHHHFIDVDSGTIYDLPWEALRVAEIDQLDGYDVHEYQVVLRGRRKAPVPQ
jgi:Fe2+ or Zn2+ uptake regulation protein